MRNQRKVLPIEEIAEKYNSGMSQDRLGAEYNVSGETIKAHLLRFGVKIRSLREAMGQESTRKALAEKAIGRTAWNTGLTKDTDERVAKFSENLTGMKRSEESIERIRASKQKHQWYNVCQECGRAKGYSRSSRCVFCAAAYRAKTYPNAMKGRKITEEHWHKMMKAQGWGKQTRPERAVEKAIKNIFSPFQVYEYTGRGGFYITFKNGKRKMPDFVNRTERKVIEVYGRYWHRNDNPADIIQKYREVGWDCLVLWEEESYLNLYDTILYFTYPYEYDKGGLELW